MPLSDALESSQTQSLLGLSHYRKCIKCAHRDMIIGGRAQALFNL